MSTSHTHARQFRRPLWPGLRLPALTLLAIPLTMHFLDRPVALFFFHALGRFDPRFALHHLFLPVMAVLLPALLIPVLQLPSARHRVLVMLRCALAVALAEGATIGLKWLFGRSSADPVFLLQHLYGFRPFHPGTVWDAFPSGTAAVLCAGATVLGRSLPHLRRSLAVSCGAFCLWLLAANAHWLSDLEAGALLGWAVGSLINSLPGASHPIAPAVRLTR